MSLLARLGWKIATAAAVAGLVLILWFRGERYAAQAQASQVLLKSAIAIGNANADAAQLQFSLAKKIDEVAAVAVIRKQRLRSDSDIVRKAINDAPMDDDGPLAPVLRDQLNRLPERTAAGADRDPPAAVAAGVSIAAE
jgi:hypothetical protein